VVFYLWAHQLLELAREADKYSINFATWDSSNPKIAQEFQDGKYQILFAHPASAAHGLTLTRATTTIWSSPTYNLEHFLQGNKRIHRIGQTRKTETLVVIAKDTIDERVAQALEAKKVNMIALLTMMENRT
jgi:SNF2 family DNA or RNA helicase